MNIFIKIITTGFFIGYIPVASGTFGSVLGCAGWVLLSVVNPVFHPLFVIVCTALGFSTAGPAEKKIFMRKDDPRIVIDEISGMLITFLTFRFGFNIQGVFFLVAGFALFRLLDIFKPPPIRFLQKIPGGVGIMLDDVACGAVANGVLQGLRLIFSHW